MGVTTPGRYVCLQVIDTGSGISPEDLTHLFEPFFTTKERGKGTGLGLATVFGIIKQHNGSISVESQLGHGTTFRIFLLPSDEGTVVAPFDEPLKARYPHGTETILLVEDEPAVRMLTRTILEKAGYTVHTAAHGPAALQIWEQTTGPIHLLLTDIVMPEGLTGRELATRLQTHQPKLKVIFTSGYSPEMAGRELALQEQQHFIAKPCPPATLLAAVRRCLDA
jgi:CheY-like chemotaxis protein